MKKRLILLAALCALLTACGGTGEPSTPEETYESPAESPAAVEEPTEVPTFDTGELTKLAMEMTWTQAKESDKDLMCMGLNSFGREWAKANLESGANKGDTGMELDWDVAVDILVVQCAGR